MMALFVCPYCGSHVEPQVDAFGGPLCPRCRNTGQAAPPTWAPPPAPAAFGTAPPPPAPFPSPGPAAYPVQGAGGQPAPAGFAPQAPYGYPAYGWTPPRPVSGKATPALVLGILGFIPYLGALVCIPGFIVSAMALKEIKAARGALDGKGMAVTGMVGASVGAFWLLIIGIGILADLDEASYDPTPPQFMLLDASGPGGIVEVTYGGDAPTYWSEFINIGDAQCSWPSGQVQSGDRILCSTDGTLELYSTDSGETVFIQYL